MKKLLLVLAFLVFLSSCAAKTPDLNVKDQSWSIYSEIDDAVVMACANSIARIESDQIEKTLPLCVNRFREFYAFHNQVWPDSDQIYYIALDVVRIWSENGIKTYADAYGCQRGCFIRFQKYPAGEILNVLEEEIINQGNILRENGYVVPIFK